MHLLFGVWRCSFNGAAYVSWLALTDCDRKFAAAMRHMFCDRLCLSSVVEMGVCFLEVAGLDCSYPVCPGVRDAAIILSWGANQQESSSCINLSQTILGIATATVLAHSAKASQKKNCPLFNLPLR